MEMINSSINISKKTNDKLSWITRIKGTSKTKLLEQLINDKYEENREIYEKMQALMEQEK